MKNKCEICGSGKKTLRETFCKPVAFIGTVFSATLCAECEKKYARGYFRHYYAVNTLAENLIREYNEDHRAKEVTMQVTYNGFTGELVKLEKKETGRYTLSPFDTEKHPVFGYDLTLYDSEKQVTHSFTGVKQDDMKFSGVEVSFG